MNNRIFKTTKELTPFIKEMIDKDKQVNLTVTGNSMFPLFSHLRDSVTVKKFNEYKKYDIILYVRKNEDLVLHRIVKVKNNEFYLCGDNQTLVEYPIYPEQVIGKVISFTRKGKVYLFNSFFSMLYARFWVMCLKIRRPLLKLALKIWRIIKK